jgi:hypothetical protein
MPKKHSVHNVEAIERRKHWIDRRSGQERRSSERLRLSGTDCRSGQPRRVADISGETTEGEIWWSNKDT